MTPLETICRYMAAHGLSASDEEISRATGLSVEQVAALIDREGAAAIAALDPEHEQMAKLACDLLAVIEASNTHPVIDIKALVFVLTELVKISPWPVQQAVLHGFRPALEQALRSTQQ